VADLWDDLLTCLELVALPNDAGYEGKNLHLAYHRLFGGQLIGQFIAATGLTRAIRVQPLDPGPSGRPGPRPGAGGLRH
jgi:acyl-CoA thioesterase